MGCILKFIYSYFKKRLNIAQQHKIQPIPGQIQMHYVYARILL